MFTDIKNDQTFTDDWSETRCLPTPKQWCLPTPKNDDQTFTDDWGEYSMFTDTETMAFTDTKQRTHAGAEMTLTGITRIASDMSRQG